MGLEALVFPGIVLVVVVSSICHVLQRKGHFQAQSLPSVVAFTRHTQSGKELRLGDPNGRSCRVAGGVRSSRYVSAVDR